MQKTTEVLVEDATEEEVEMADAVVTLLEAETLIATGAEVAEEEEVNLPLFTNILNSYYLYL